jgi:hypothetical protein
MTGTAVIGAGIERRSAQQGRDRCAAVTGPSVVPVRNAAALS